MFGCKNFITQFPSLNFYHSAFITRHLIFHTRLAPSPTSHHSIFFTLFVGPIPVTWSEHFCFVTRGRFSSPSAFSFLISPSPFSPVTLPKHKPKPIKISQAPSPRQDRHHWTTPISLTCTAAQSPPLWPSGADEHKETWSISPFCHEQSPSTQDGATSSLYVLSYLVYLFDLCDSHLGFEKNEWF